ncbi:MAG: glycosyltransferase family 2 protein [bacterium]
MKINHNNENLKDFTSDCLFDKDLVLKKNKSFPKISIITPSYNQGRYLERTILSVLNQNYPNLEYIIIDGGSTDNSVEIIKKYEKYLTYWISEKDKGQSDALNKGFKIAAGEIIGWQNSDDIYLPKTFFKIVDLFDKYKQADIIYGDRLDIDEKDGILGESIFTDFSTTVCLYDGLQLGTQSVFWRKEVFAKIGMLDINLHFAMDYEFFLRAGKRGLKYKYFPYRFGAMRRHREAKTEIYSGTPLHNKEKELIDKKYGRIKLLNLPLKIYSLLFRAFNYCFHGNSRYLFNGLSRRFGNNSLLSGQ